MVQGVLGDTDKETFSSISITKNPYCKIKHSDTLYTYRGYVFNPKILSPYSIMV